MPNTYFRFKQFTIHQETCAMKVGTDGVLLGAWADLTATDRLLDIGTGSGLIAIMAAQRTTSTHIDAIDIDPAACRQAAVNIQQTPWFKRIHLFQKAIQDFHPPYHYNNIICNPPFFINSTTTPLNDRTIARHCTTLTHHDLFQAVQRLLTPDGKFHLILPVPEAELFIQYVLTQNWFIHKITKVHPTPEKETKRYLLQISPIAITSTQIETLIIEIERHKYHESFIHYMREFYLYL